MPDFSPTSVSNNGDDPDPVTSPCISVCTVDPVSKLCIGCLRTLKEIGAWRVMTPDEKRAVVAACAERAKSISPRGRDGRPLTAAD
jgi:predicted Fe-S protein YdhL (DUF1289 family)